MLLLLKYFRRNKIGDFGTKYCGFMLKINHITGLPENRQFLAEHC
jgi:hypothetical protein